MMQTLSSQTQSWIKNFKNLSPDSRYKLLAGMTREQKLKLKKLLDELNTRANSKLFKFFPETGPLRRELYTKHMAFFKAGKEIRSRLFMAGNRVGKTITGCTEDVYHLTGLYPEWWEGKVFNEPIRAWVAGKTNETTRDIIQLELLGNVTYENGKKTFDGTGLIPSILLERLPGGRVSRT